MELTEDIPVLIPFAVILSLFLVALVGIYTNYIELNELIYLGRSSLSTGEAILASMSLKPGILDISYLPHATGNESIETPRLYFSEPDFNYSIQVQDLERNITWYWGEHHEGRVAINLPTLIGNSTKTYLGIFRMVVTNG